MFSPISLGKINLDHRIVMAPLTRMRASEPGLVPTPVNVDYYQQRATKGGLLITEATVISRQGQGNPSTPGIFSQEQVEGWKNVVNAVHAKQGRIVLQLWHVGRVSHPDYHDGEPPVSASNVKYPFQVLTPSGNKDTVAPKPLTLKDIDDVVEDFRVAAVNAKEAGFDGVELHGANGYLLDQFLNSGTNLRTDQYGGSFENRTRLLFRVLDVLLKVWGTGRVGLRLSPHTHEGPFSVTDDNPEETYSYVVTRLNNYADKLAYLHIIEATRSFFDDNYDISAKFPILEKYSKLYKGKVIGASGITPENGPVLINDKICDCIAFGRFFISTPDLVKRLKNGLPLNKYNRKTFITMGTENLTEEQVRVGYTDYPIYSNTKEADLINPKITKP